MGFLKRLFWRFQKNKICKYCYGKGTYSVFKGEIGYEDFGGDGYYEAPTIQHFPCKKCQ